MSDCGCPQTTPSSLNCGASLNIPIDQLLCPVNSSCPTTGGSPSVSFHQAISGFVVPVVGGQSSLSVANGALFVPGQWIQFVNPAGTFRIISIVGNVLTLSNAAPDGITALTGNPVPPYQYQANAAFVTVDQPNQLTSGAFATLVQTAIASLQSICLDEIPTQGVTEQVWLLGYLKSSLCGDNEGCCLRKQDIAYIDQDGALHFEGTIVADAFSVPVPEGGVPSSNSTSLNPNNGTGGGFLLPFYNPTTGTVTYIDLFSGATNGQSYFVTLSATGQVSLTKGDVIKVYFPDKEVVKGAGSYAGYAAADVDVSTIIGGVVPTWANFAKVNISSRGCVSANAALQVNLNTENALRLSYRDSSEYNFECERLVELTAGKFNLEILTYNDVEGTSAGNVPFDQTGFNEGYIRVSITALLIADV